MRLKNSQLIPHHILETLIICHTITEMQDADGNNVFLFLFSVCTATLHQFDAANRLELIRVEQRVIK